MSSNRRLALVLAALLAACSGLTGTDGESDPRTFIVVVNYDSLIQSSGAPAETRTATTGTLLGTLLLDPFTAGPAGDLTCESGCTGAASTLRGATPGDTTGSAPGVWHRDTLSISLYFTATDRLDLKGTFAGDSIMGSAERVTQATTKTVYKGRFIARRSE